MVSYGDLNCRIKRQIVVNARTELDDASLLSPDCILTFYGIAHYPTGKTAGNLLEQNRTAEDIKDNASMLVVQRSLRLEGKHMLAGMILIIFDHAVGGPEIGMYVKEIHVDTDLPALGTQDFLLKCLLADDHLAVGDGSQLGRSGRALAIRHMEKIDLPCAEPEQKYRGRH